jgi:hypothetical protein
LERIRNILWDGLEADIQNLDVTPSVRLEKGDLVRIRVEPKPGLPKRAQVKWSDEVYTVLEVHPRHNTAKLLKTGENNADGRVRSSKQTRAIDQLKKVVDLKALTEKKSMNKKDNQEKEKDGKDPASNSNGPCARSTKKKPYVLLMKLEAGAPLLIIFVPERNRWFRIIYYNAQMFFPDY